MQRVGQVEAPLEVWGAGLALFELHHELCDLVTCDQVGLEVVAAYGRIVEREDPLATAGSSLGTCSLWETRGKESLRERNILPLSQ